MPAHKHAAAMLQYAQDAAETEEPWKLWRFIDYSGNWRDCDGHPSWIEHLKFERKPRTIRIGEFDVPEPLRDMPTVGSRIWGPNPLPHCIVSVFTWSGEHTHMMLLKAGLCHLNRDAAELHAIALISLSKTK